MKKLNYLLLSIALFFSFTIDDDFLKKIITQLDKYNNEFPQEKAYIHTDKSYYTAGETIWLKAYLVEAMTNFPDTVSVPLYVELIDNQAGKLVDKKIIKLEGGFGEGDFQLADTLKAGFYSLRAYTNWMQNFTDDFLFSKEFKVYQVGQSEAPLKGNAQAIDFQFFPEGGYLVEGISSRLAFKAIDITGKGLDLTGIITNEKGDTLMQFETEHLGMGVFNFKPEPNEKYFCKVKYRNIYEKDIDFPEIKKEGVVLGVQNLWGKDQIRISVTHNFKSQEGNFYVVGQSRGNITYGAKAPLTKKSVFMNVPKSNFKNGVVQFTIFDEKGIPKCERVIFLENNKPLNISVLTNKKIYKPREKVSLEIEAKDHEGKPVEGNFSLSVLDGKQILESINEENIQSYLLLSSDLKGKIEQPAYYFDKENPKLNAHLDLLMLTQGWRRFKWEEVMKPELPAPNFFLERGITLSGEVHRQNGKVFEKPVNITLMMTMKDSTRNFGMAECDIKTGAFTFIDLNFIDSAKVVIQAVAGKENRNTNITINKPFSPKIRITKIPFAAVEFDAKALEDYLKRTKEILELEKKLRLDKIQLLQEVVVKAKRKPEERDNRVIHSGADATIEVNNTNSMGAFSIFDLIRSRVPGVQVTGSMTNPNVIIRGVSTIMGSSEPLYLLDGMPVDKQMMLSLSVQDVEKIEILKGASASIYGSRGGAGVISVLTKRGNPNYEWTDNDIEGIKVLDIAGYYPKREFYSPKYDENKPEHVRPDFRSTVFWKPAIKTDANGKAKIEFFNTDAETNMRVSLEGLSYSGLPFATKMTYEVRK